MLTFRTRTRRVGVVESECLIKYTVNHVWSALHSIQRTLKMTRWLFIQCLFTILTKACFAKILGLSKQILNYLQYLKKSMQAFLKTGISICINHYD